MGVGLFHGNNSVFSIYCKYSKIDLYATVIDTLRLYKSFLQILYFSLSAIKTTNEKTNRKIIIVCNILFVFVPVIHHPSYTLTKYYTILRAHLHLLGRVSSSSFFLLFQDFLLFSSFLGKMSSLSSFFLPVRALFIKMYLLWQF